MIGLGWIMMYNSLVEKSIDNNTNSNNISNNNINNNNNHIKFKNNINC
jgi:hypothetical protein